MAKMPDKRAGPLLEHGSTQGAQGGVLGNNITAMSCPVLVLLLKYSTSSTCPLLCEDLLSSSAVLFYRDAAMGSAKLFIY